MEIEFGKYSMWISIWYWTDFVRNGQKIENNGFSGAQFRMGL